MSTNEKITVEEKVDRLITIMERLYNFAASKMAGSAMFNKDLQAVKSELKELKGK